MCTAWASSTSNAFLLWQPLITISESDSRKTKPERPPLPAANTTSRGLVISCPAGDWSSSGFPKGARENPLISLFIAQGGSWADHPAKQPQHHPHQARGGVPSPKNFLVVTPLPDGRVGEEWPVRTVGLIGRRNDEKANSVVLLPKKQTTR